jgi:hypothetical protein
VQSGNIYDYYVKEESGGEQSGSKRIQVLSYVQADPTYTWGNKSSGYNTDLGWYYNATKGFGSYDVIGTIANNCPKGHGQYAEYAGEVDAQITSSKVNYIATLGAIVDQSNGQNLKKTVDIALTSPKDSFSPYWGIVLVPTLNYDQINNYGSSDSSGFQPVLTGVVSTPTPNLNLLGSWDPNNVVDGSYAFSYGFKYLVDAKTNTSVKVVRDKQNDTTATVTLTF